MIYTNKILHRLHMIIGEDSCESCETRECETCGIGLAKDVLEVLNSCEKKQNITNKEWLATLSPEEWYKTVYWLFHNYGKGWTNTRLAVMDWLNEERHVL